ncbi:MAG TPA: hypothetical protein VKC59_04755 [Candidatus Limnocylindrales bacterium]|nr:hypothetical protein [Candidatus Limnocylindrales bacterium]
MTRNREIERVLEEWFSEGPTQMPDHLFTAVVDRIDRVPQRRLAQLTTRLLAMNSNLRLAAAAAIILAVAGVGAFAFSRGPSSGTGQSPAATGTSGPSPSPLSAALQFSWVGATRTVADITPPIQRSVLRFTGATLSYFTGGPNPILFSTASQDSPTSIVLTLTVSGYGCQIGDVGRYSFTLAGSTRGGGTMSLHANSDNCPARQAAILGDWVRAACADQNGWCLGDLDPGTYGSMSFNPFVASSAWTSDYGALSYSVPAGWTNTEDCDYCFRLAKQGGSADPPGIIMFSDVAAMSQNPDCQAIPEPGVAQTATAIATWLKSLPGLVATTPVPITIGGLSGRMLDISVAPTWTRTCSFSNGQPVVTTLTHASGATGFDWNVGGTVRERVILLDSGAGPTLLIEIDAPDQAAFDTLVAESMPVIQSFRFKP